MKIAFRTDASHQIGTGHVMRCLTLADELGEQGAQCQFVCREHKGHLMEHIQSRGYAVQALAEPQASTTVESGLKHSCWLGVDWQTDAKETHDALTGVMLDWIIVDHYSLDHRWESAVRSSCNHIMAIDDLADRRHDCDLLLDQNYGSSAERYQGLVSPSCKQCHGPEYALLKPAYAERRSQMPVRDGTVRRVLINFGGGADEKNLTGLAVQAFEVPELSHIALDIVVGQAYAHQSSLEELAVQHGNSKIHQQLPDLADLMAKADLAIGGGGATTWERCCMGLPSLVISIADNQRPACEALAAEGLIEYLGEANVYSVERLVGKVIELRECPKNTRQIGIRGSKLVDGIGAKRVRTAIEDDK